MKQFTIRLDDITPDMNWDNFYIVKDILDKYQLKPLLGVVPDNRDELLQISDSEDDFFQKVCAWQNEGYCIAQHGYQHIYETTDAGMLGLNPFSEFSGLSYEEQYEKLKKGKEILHWAGIETDIFMPPGHTYDNNTLKALRELGFKYITDGFYNKPYKAGGIICFPCTMLESYKGKGINTLCFHLNGKSRKQLEEFENFIKTNREYIVDFDCEKLSQKAVNKTLRVAVGEKMSLFKYRAKQWLSNNPQFAAYMQKTNASSAVAKIIKRIICLPSLIIMLITKTDR